MQRILNHSFYDYRLCLIESSRDTKCCWASRFFKLDKPRTNDKRGWERNKNITAGEDWETIILTVRENYTESRQKIVENESNSIPKKIKVRKF